MLRPSGMAVCVLLLAAGGLPAFEVQATLKKVDADRGVMVFTANNQDHTVQVPQDVKIFDKDGKELADGLKAKELKEGAAVTLTVERKDDKPVLRTIRLGGTRAAAVPAATSDWKLPGTSNLVPLTDLGEDKYKGFSGGLYPGGKNERPAGHEEAGLALAKTIQPLDADGKPSADGKIVLLGIGFSNTVQVFNGFMQVAEGDKLLNPHVVLVNGAVGGMSANMIANPDKGRGKQYWETVDEKLKAAKVTRAQVQVIWLKETNPAPHEGNFPGYIQTLQSELTKIVEIIAQRFPNVKQTYVSSRSYGGWARPTPGRAAPGNSEPYSYETGFAVKWLIEQQLKGDPALNFDPSKGAVKAPWLSWGPYLWANGDKKRKDGFSYQLTDYGERDRMHHSPDGMKKTGTMLLNFFKTDPTTQEWFLQGLDPKIGPANPKKYKDVRDAKDWANPYLTVLANGIEVRATGLPGGSKIVPVGELWGTLAGLPVAAWPYGRVIAGQEIGIRSGNDDAAIKKNKAKAEKVLKALQVTAEWWPSA